MTLTYAECQTLAQWLNTLPESSVLGAPADVQAVFKKLYDVVESPE